MPPSIAELRPVLGAHQLGEPVAITELKGGSSPSFRIERGDGTFLVLKTYALADKIPAHDAYAARLISHLCLPITRYLVVDDSRTLLPFPFALTNYLPGVPVATFTGTPEARDLHRQIGALLRTLHSVRLPAFGHFSESGILDPVADNADYMRAGVAHAFARFRHYGADPALAGTLEAIVAANADLFAQSIGPVFAHDDLHPNNVLAQRDRAGHLQLSGLIDFGNARAADPISDLAKTLFICAHDAPGCTAAIRQGYGPVNHPDPEAALWLYTLVHRVVMWWWLRHVGAIPDGVGDPLVDDLRQMAEEGRPSSPSAVSTPTPATRH